MLDIDNQPSRILCVENDPQGLASLRAQLEREFEFHAAANSAQALEMLKEHGPYEAVIAGTHEEMPGQSLLESIKNFSPATVSIVLTTESDLPKARDAVDKGFAYRFIMKPCSEDELVATINSAVLENTRTIHKQQLKAEAEELIQPGDVYGFTPIFDPELGIGSSEALLVELQYLHNVAVRYKRPYSIAVFDIDIIRLYGTHYGSKAAKLAHKLLAEHLRHSCRAADRVFRLNKETPVALILPETGNDGCKVYTLRAVQSFAARNIPNSKSEHHLLTISSGITSYNPGSDGDKNWQDLLDEAVLYLHVAQGQGGNCVSFLGACE